MQSCDEGASRSPSEQRRALRHSETPKARASRLHVARVRRASGWRRCVSCRRAHRRCTHAHAHVSPPPRCLVAHTQRALRRLCVLRDHTSDVIASNGRRTTSSSDARCVRTRDAREDTSRSQKRAATSNAASDEETESEHADYNAWSQKCIATATAASDDDTESELADDSTTVIENCLKRMLRSIELAYLKCRCCSCCRVQML